MELNYNVSGADRKRLVKVIGEVLGVKPKYMGTPSFAFLIGSYKVSKHGVLTFEEDEQTATVLEAIEVAGFTAGQPVGEVLAESTEPPQAEGVASTEDIANLSIIMPRETFTDAALANLDALLDSKGELIK